MAFSKTVRKIETYEYNALNKREDSVTHHILMAEQSEEKKAKRNSLMGFLGKVQAAGATAIQGVKAVGSTAVSERSVWISPLISQQSTLPASAPSMSSRRSPKSSSRLPFESSLSWLLNHILRPRPLCLGFAQRRPSFRPRLLRALGAPRVCA
jgi:hypothetical protein